MDEAEAEAAGGGGGKAAAAATVMGAVDSALPESAPGVFDGN